jgi:3-phosphoglycerate kinase
VLLRVDVNVPINNGKVEDTFRIEQFMPTIEHLIKTGIWAGQKVSGMRASHLNLLLN